MDSNRYGVYVLIDPRDRSIRYVGQTCDFGLRYKQHISSAKIVAKKNPEKRAWIDDLKSQGLLPIQKVVRRNLSSLDALNIEAQCIWCILEDGMPLLNRKIKDRRRVMDQILEKVAQYHNYSSSTELALAIGSGEIATVLLPDEQRSWAIRWLEEQSKLIDDPFLGEVLASISRQIYESVKREYELEQEEMRSSESEE